VSRVAAPGRKRRRWTAEQVRALGFRTTVPIAGEIIAGLSETQAYALHERGEFPVPVIRVGRRLIVPVQPILDLLHASGGDDLDAAS